MLISREYPFNKPRIYFTDANKRLAHVNVFNTGTIDSGCCWHPESHNLVYLIKRLMLLMTFDPMAICFDSMSDKNYRDWMKKMVLNRKFPTFKWSEPVTATRKIIKLN